MSFKTVQYICLFIALVSVQTLCNADNIFWYELQLSQSTTALSVDSDIRYQQAQQDSVTRIDTVYANNPLILFPNIEFDKPLALIVVLTLVILYSIASMVIILIFVLINRGRRERLENKISRLKEQYQTALVDYLDPEIDNTELLERIHAVANSNFTRRILINEMIDLSINLQDEEAKKLRGLYYQLGLNTDSINKIKTRIWHIRVKGYKECAFMDMVESKPLIEKGLHSRNDIVRSEAQLALVRLNNQDPYAFLDNLKRPFSVWEQNIVHEAITYHGLAIPDFERWLFSENESVVKFSAKMIQLFEQKSAWPKLVKLLEHENDKIRAAAIKTLGHLKVNKSQIFLKNAFEEETIENKILIIKSLIHFNTRINLVFFKHIIEEEDDVWIQVEAAKGIRELGETGNKELIRLLDREEYRNYQIIIKHVLDKRL